MIVNRVSRLLGERRKSVADLARGIDVAYSTAYALYRGSVTRIELETLDRLCRYFGVTPAEIFEYTPGEVNIDTHEEAA